MCISHPSLQGVLTCPPFISARWDTAWFTRCSCSELQNYVWAGEVSQSRSCTKPWGPWSRWWLEWLTVAPAFLSLADQESKWERTCVLDVLQLWVCAVSPTTPQRAGEEESTWLGGWRKESWNHLDFSLSERYDVTDVSPSGEWNEADLEWR